MRDFSTLPAASCPLCGTSQSYLLPEPATHSMTSDWRVTSAPLGKLSCAGCGVVYRDPTLPPPADFASGYELYAHATGNAAEQTRQAAYAAWIAASVRRPARVLDVGCGNGSLLLALREQWPDSELSGCDLSPDSVRHAIDAGLDAWAGTAENLPAARRADLVVSVNVVEHTPDPGAFVESLRRALAPGGELVIVCPDGARPSVDLLIADHLCSFTAAHLRLLFDQSGLTMQRWSAAPQPLGAFQMAVASDQGVERFEALRRSPADLRGAQQAYLEAWQRLDAALTERLPSAVVCFGTGEAAGLLRAYAPAAWSRVRACTTDAAAGEAFGSVPYVPLDAVPVGATVLVGVRPQDQERIAGRLRGRFAGVVTWYDLVPSDGT